MPIRKISAPPLATLIPVSQQAVSIQTVRPWAQWFQEIKAQSDAVVLQQTGAAKIAIWPGLAFTTDILSDVENMKVNLDAGLWYNFRILLNVIADPTGGFKFKIDGTAVPEMLNFHVDCMADDLAALGAGVNMLSLGRNTSGLWSPEINVTSYYPAPDETPAFVTIEGMIHVRTAGTMILQFAQRVASGTTWLGCGSVMLVTEML